MSETRLTDGSWDFSAGVDSGRVTTVQSPSNPNGLPRNMMAWLSNGTVRNGGIAPRGGWLFRKRVCDGSKLYQAGYLYKPLSGNPYLVLSIGGILWQVRVDTDYAVNELTTPGLENPANVSKAYMEQAEQFLVIQAGDWARNANGTPPLFWDGSLLRRSNGITGNITNPNINEIPAALAMTYYQGRLWYANGRKYTAGDIVDDANSGTSKYDFTDSVLKVTENPLALKGDGFIVPSQAGDIVGLSYTATLDSNLGQGNLYIFTREQVNALVVPVSRSDWIGATASNWPRQIVAMTRFGAVGDRSIVRVNGDLFYASPEPAIRSYTVATRYFQQWGNVPISRNIQRALNATSANGMINASGINFDNRLLMTLLPVPTPVGIAYQAVAALNFDLISTLQQQLPPAWEGPWGGQDILQMFEGDFSGMQRAFAVVHNRKTHDIEIWELTANGTVDCVDNRIQWFGETPAYTFGVEYKLKQLDGAEIYIDEIFGDVTIEVDYRPDSDPCWQPWFKKKICAARDTCEITSDPVCYPNVTLCKGFKFPLVLPRPQNQECSEFGRRMSWLGYQFQLRIKVTGYCRIRGIMVFAVLKEVGPFAQLSCDSET